MSNDSSNQVMWPAPQPLVFESYPHGENGADDLSDQTSQDDTIVEAFVTAQDPVEALTEPVEEESKRPNWFWRNKVVLAAGSVTVASLVANPLEETINTVGDVAPYVVPGVLAAEAAWIAGAGLMLAAVGKKVLNPLKIRAAISEIPEHAANSTLFKSGLVLNTAAAITQFVIPAVAVTTKMPVEAWGVLSFSTIDLWATYVMRRMIWRGMQNAKKPNATVE